MVTNKGWDGHMVEELSCVTYLYKNGLGKKREGDIKTKCGDYGFMMAFSMKEDPVSRIHYIKVTNTLYCCGDKEYFNQIIYVIKIDHKCTDNSDHLFSYQP